MQVTTAGVVGTWWFVPNEANRFCSSALMDSLGRATTYSFGSICLGSFIVALVQALRALERHTRNSDDLQFVSCIIQCLLACIEGIIEEINKWAYGMFRELYRLINVVFALQVKRLFSNFFFFTAPLHN